MSVLTATRDVATAGPAPRRRRRRGTIVVVLGLVVAVVVVALLRAPDRQYTATFDPDNPGPDGAQALARVLDDDGVDVTVVRDADAFDHTLVDDRTTVVVTSTSDLGSSTARDLLAHAGAGHLLLIQPTYAALEVLGVQTDPSSDVDADVTASCPEYRGGLVDGLRLQTDGIDYYDDADGCFDGGAGEAPALTTLPASQGTVTLFGAGEALSNGQITRADNAAIALRLLGGDQHLVWYVPDLQDQVAGDGVSLRSLLPRFLGPALLLLLLVVVALTLWRGRRMGPLATEPLPVVVRAAETTRSLGRLYRRSGDRGHAATVLRAATRARLARYLGLGSLGDDPGAERSLIAATAHYLDSDERLVGPLLDSTAAPPRTDADLIRLAADLTALEREVHDR